MLSTLITWRSARFLFLSLLCTHRFFLLEGLWRSLAVSFHLPLSRIAFKYTVTAFHLSQLTSFFGCAVFLKSHSNAEKPMKEKHSTWTEIPVLHTQWFSWTNYQNALWLLFQQGGKTIIEKRCTMKQHFTLRWLSCRCF